MSTTKLGVIGAGSIFTPELVDQLARETDALGAVDLVLMDNDPARLALVGGVCERIVARLQKPVTITYADTYEAAITGADFVLVQFRVGGQEARISDDQLGLKYKIPFVETVTVCGFSAFLRSFYEVEKIAKLVNELAPQAWVLNFSNPAGMLAEAFSRLGCKKVIGLCNASVFFKEFFARELGVAADQIFMNWRGLNHLTFVDIVQHQGRNVLPELLDKVGASDLPYLPFSAEFLHTFALLPNYYLQYHFMHDDVVKKLQACDHTRAEEVKEVNTQILDLYRTADRVPDELRKRGGFGYSRAVVSALRGIRTGDHSIHYVVLRNGSTLPELPPDAYVEVPAIALDNDLRAIQVEPLPTLARSLIVTMKDYETTLIKAAMASDRTAFLTALMIHPLIGSYSLAQPLLADVLEHNARYLPAELTGA